ncbi:hypothetical protein DL771_005112 [Monosporascus sp. 5C6A]|nr:hypothetical protein DL771_005112 [Monosporascus sp. 5C6A]
MQIHPQTLGEKICGRKLSHVLRYGSRSRNNIKMLQRLLPGVTVGGYLSFPVSRDKASNQDERGNFPKPNPSPPSFHLRTLRPSA